MGIGTPSSQRGSTSSSSPTSRSIPSNECLLLSDWTADCYTHTHNSMITFRLRPDPFRSFLCRHALYSYLLIPLCFEYTLAMDGLGYRENFSNSPSWMLTEASGGCFSREWDREIWSLEGMSGLPLVLHSPFKLSVMDAIWLPIS